MPESRHLATGVLGRLRQVGCDHAGLTPGFHPPLRLDEEPGALLRGPKDDRPRAEDPRSDRALERIGVGGERHPRGDVRGHHPVLGDGDEQ